MQFRPAATHEMDQVYLMGFDAWAEGQSRAEYLADCRASRKYKSGRWFVLSADSLLRSSLLVHDFEPWGGRIVRGIGSVATVPDARNRGYGHAIVQEAVRALVEREMAKVLFLFSDIGAHFYEKEGFRILPAEYQTAKGSVAMIRMLPEYDNRVIGAFRHKIPSYF